jgi:hypothetical protein
VLLALASVLGGPLLEGRARAQDGTGKVAGWVFWGWCPNYGIMSPGAAAPSGAAEAQAGAPSGPGAEARPGGPTVIYPQPCPGPVPAVGALVALQGTSLAAKADEEGFFLIENVPLGVYYTAAASYPRRRPIPAASTESGRPAAPTIAPVVCAAGSASRANVMVSDANRPTFVGALIVGWSGPRPLAPGQAVPMEAPDDGASD